MSQIISRDALRTLIDAWIGEGKRVAGPSRGKNDLVLYKHIAASNELAWDGFLRPSNSIKEFVFPAHEKLYGYRLQGKRIVLYDLPPLEEEQVIVAARPCDAAALPILDYVFNWDTKDALYNHRRRLTAVVTLACATHDTHCFCTSLGSGPDDERGSDVLLVDLGDGRYEVRLLTEKGKALFAGQTETSDAVGKVGPGPRQAIDLKQVQDFLTHGFESPVWNTLGMRCLGCGACAYSCPTCHCFDIVDEGNGAGGVRARNWDACQFANFTMHASGHNPRSVQAQRQRQRIFHKFRTYPEKFGELLCTGCGNCARNCPVSLGVPTALETIRQFVATAANGECQYPSPAGRGQG